MAKIICIDPGHGGVYPTGDPGAMANGFREAELVLPPSLFLRNALRRSGVSVVMTREKDALPLPSRKSLGEDLAYRARIANNAKAALFVSWHMDAGATADPHGIAVWIHPSQKGKALATKAARISASVAAATGLKDRGVCYGDFQVLRDTAMDAVLIECGFITNPGDVQCMAKEVSQRKSAEAVAREICTILGANYVPESSAPFLDPEAAKLSIALYGSITQTSIEEITVACNYAANALRRAVGLEITTDLGKPTKAAADIIIRASGTMWEGARTNQLRKCFNVAADSLREALSFE
ncbi:hypothetical protein CIG75_12690 [Tumebacillus algifaecis]|uniref:MurNAc-LAA domain-containing protein n=1 Tax=Tumebacillus algifaecis TaxID=1214604 RepID=A0A223D2X7_9BACL|nr:N-acetylmuramoyl-L-alanine amidase [Tumebacillus algifaecis]ASS75756.1 hypothetical protein CIG75_12690 [Tumebacillus algifaecis]